MSIHSVGRFSSVCRQLLLTLIVVELLLLQLLDFERNARMSCSASSSSFLLSPVIAAAAAQVVGA